MTIHITPEPGFSYVSFETNVPQASYKDVIQRVINTFQPGNFVLTVFANEVSALRILVKRLCNLFPKFDVNLSLLYRFQESLAADTAREVEKMSTFDRFKRQDVQYCKLKDYDLTYAFYSKFPS